MMEDSLYDVAASDAQNVYPDDETGHPVHEHVSSGMSINKVSIAFQQRDWPDTYVLPASGPVTS